MGVIIDGEKWFLKYLKSTKSRDVHGLSYSTSSLSEYHIYESLGMDSHKTRLGYANNKIVVACKDFLGTNEIIIDYI